MSQELQIPLLHELISRGETDASDLHFTASDHDQIDIVDETHDPDDISRPEPVTLSELENDDFLGEDFNSVQELLIEEEVRMILDKHMENAYEEIIRLIHHHITPKG
jgi:hypothetical protein